MTDDRAPQPFRPPQFASPLSALDTVERQVKQVRRRVNLYAIQDALYRVVGSALLGASALAVLAGLVSRTTFAIVLWALFGTILIASIRIFGKARERWIGVQNAAVLIDRRAGLADRLATLEGTAKSQSSLWQILVEQNLRMLWSWTPKRISPRPVPASLGLFLISLAIAIMAFRWVAVTTTTRAEQANETLGPNPISLSYSDRHRGSETLPHESTPLPLLASLPDTIRTAILGADASSETGESRQHSGSEAVGEIADELAKAQKMDKSGHSADPSLARPNPKSNRINNQKQQAKTAGQKKSDEQIIEGVHSKELQPAKQVAGKNKRRINRPQVTQHNGTPGKGASDGTGPGGREGLYGNPKAGDSRGGNSFDLDLIGRETAGKRQRGNSPRAQVTSALSTDQRLDDAIRRAQVPPDYETIVQRLFARATTAKKER